METISVTLPVETVEAISSEAEMQDFDSRSAYLRYIIQQRGEIESVDQTEVDVVEAIAERFAETYREEFSELESHQKSLEREIVDLREISDDVMRQQDFIDNVEHQVSEIGSTVASLEKETSRYERKQASQHRDIRNNQDEIEHVKDQIRRLKSDIQEIRESDGE